MPAYVIPAMNTYVGFSFLTFRWKNSGIEWVPEKKITIIIITVGSNSCGNNYDTYRKWFVIQVNLKLGPLLRLLYIYNRLTTSQKRIDQESHHHWGAPRLAVLLEKKATQQFRNSITVTAWWYWEGWLQPGCLAIYQQWHAALTHCKTLERLCGNVCWPI